MDGPLQILIVDDDLALASVVRRLLAESERQHEIAQAATLAEARQQIAGSSFDCILLDYQLPDGNGMDLLREWQGNGSTTAVVAMTAQGDDQLAADLLAAGATAYLSKARLTADSLIRAVEAAVCEQRDLQLAEAGRQQLFESEQRFRVMADTAPVMLWMSDAHGRSYYFSQQWLRFRGRTLEQEANQGWHNGVHPDDLPATMRDYLQAFSERREFSIEYRLLRYDGAWRWVRDSGVPRSLPDGSFAGYIGSASDITDRREAENKLRESNDALAAIIQSSPLPIYALDNQGLVTVWNPACERVFGWPVEEVIGKYLPLSGPRPRDEFDAICGRALRGEKISNVEVVRIRKSGTAVDLSISAACIRDSAGQIKGALVITDDITLRKAAEIERMHLLRRERRARAEADAARNRFEFLAQASTILSASLDYQTTLSSMARLAVPAMGDWCLVHMQMPEGVIRQIAVAHMDPAKIELSVEVSRRYPVNAHLNFGVAEVLRTGKSQFIPHVSDELLHQMAQDDQHLSVLHEMEIRSMIIVPLEARGRTFGTIAFMSGESNRTYTQLDLSLAEDLARRAAIAVDNARLYREAQRALAAQERREQEAREAKESAEAANRAKDQFLAVLSHELRTPLTPVLIAVQSLGSEQRQMPELAPTLEMIRRNVELEARLIDDLLDLTRISRGKLELNLHAVNAHDCLNNALEICRGDLTDKEIELTMAHNAHRCWVWADPARLQQIFWNLIKNAVKFTPKCGRVAISTFNRDHRLVVQVIDNGIGIEPQVLPIIFEAFEQGERSVTRQFGGLGLGLAITRALVERHGGTITAESEGKDRGAIFTVDLASIAEPCIEKTIPTAVPAVMSRNGLRILMVDDHEDTSRAMKMLLERHGYCVRVANTVSGALEAASGEGFDLLISDIGLPDGTGLDLITNLRSRLGTIKGIALSGFGMEADIQRSKAAGFAEHLTKPIDLNRLQAVIRELTATVN